MKVLFVTQQNLMPYRIPIFRLVNECKDIDLTLGHCGKRTIQNEIKEIHLEIKHLAKFNYFKNFSKICSRYDVVLCMAYFNNLSIIKACLNNSRKYKLVLWSIGVRASYSHQFGSSSPYEKLITFFFKKADALLFYSSYPIEKYRKLGISKDKMYVANNTVSIPKINLEQAPKDKLIFVGTLYKEKGIERLLQLYKKALKLQPNLLDLVIIGDGDLQYFRKITTNLGIEKKVLFTGGIYDENILSNYFKSSLLCLSPQQAGLSVLKSMGYGVPFVTSENAITGGERLNIKNGINGVIFKTEDEFVSILVDSANSTQKYIEMGHNAYHYYWKERTPQIMANGIINAIRHKIIK